MKGADFWTLIVPTNLIMSIVMTNTSTVVTSTSSRPGVTGVCSQIPAKSASFTTLA